MNRAGYRCKQQGANWIALLTTAALCLDPAGVLSDSMTPEDIYAQIVPSVVTLKVLNSKGERFTGTAFLAMTQNVAVTAWHVVHDAVQVTALFADGEAQPVTGVIDKDELRDVALISLKSGDRPLIQFKQTHPRVGSKTYVIGAPRGYGFSIADGLLSQIQEVDGFTQYQVSCPFSTGNSGSPVVNDQAEVIGAASWSKSRAQNLNFATPAVLISLMNPHEAAVPWREMSQANHNPDHSQQSAVVMDKTQEGHSELKALQDLFRAASGQPVTVLVQRANEPERSFSFIVPPEAGR
jgi:S1-C subfamily serine protease